MSFVWGITFIGMIKFAISFKEKPEVDLREKEVYNRLLTLYQKNKFGFHTRIMSDFDLLLEAVLNEKFIDDSTAYYDDPVTLKEIEDVELGLNGDLTEEDIKHLTRDKQAHPEAPKVFFKPGRVGSNYEKSDDLSVYKVLPKGQKPKV